MNIETATPSPKLQSAECRVQTFIHSPSSSHPVPNYRSFVHIRVFVVVFCRELIRIQRQDKYRYGQRKRKWKKVENLHRCANGILIMFKDDPEGEMFGRLLCK